MKVFISHAYTDQPLVRKVAAALEGVGLEVWDATRDVSPGDSWPDKVAQALSDSDAMVVVLTADALRSSWVLKEIEFALSEQSYRGRLIPVLVRDPEALHKEDIPWILRRLRMINMGEYDEEEEGINQIVTTLLENDITNPPSTSASIN
ncbi:MAG: toll/interleukin-1 receptor domain-containing protein [Gemmatimonadota bacterium]|nr:toll/interleukin-1 receptor domain-containing protein [Gemmatimonadota bacterium]